MDNINDFRKYPPDYQGQTRECAICGFESVIFSADLCSDCDKIYMDVSIAIEERTRKIAENTNEYDEYSLSDWEIRIGEYLRFNGMRNKAYNLP